MRTNIEIDDELMKQALASTGSKTKKDVVETALKLLVRTRGQGSIRQLRGKIHWEGDLHQSRLSRFPEE